MMNQKYYPVDVIVPIYNVEEYLYECIDSILSQTYPHVNLILVDDGSTDQSGHICDDYAYKNNNIKVVHKENEGLVSAWKMGLSSSDSNWVMFIDGDDWIEEKHIETLVFNQIETGADLIVSPMKQVGVDGTYILKFLIPPGNYGEDRLRKELYPVMLNTGGFETRGIPVSRCSKLIKRQLMIDNMQYCNDSNTFEEDFSIMFPAMLDAKGISLIQAEKALYCYRRIKTSMLHAYDSHMEESVSNVYTGVIRACHDKEKLDFLPQVYNEYLCAMIRRVTNELQNPEGFKTVVCNVNKIRENVLLKKIINGQDVSKYPLRFKLIVQILKSDNMVSKVLLCLLYNAKKIMG